MSNVKIIKATCIKLFATTKHFEIKTEKEEKYKGMYILK